MAVHALLLVLAGVLLLLCVAAARWAMERQRAGDRVEYLYSRLDRWVHPQEGFSAEVPGRRLPGFSDREKGARSSVAPPGGRALRTYAVLPPRDRYPGGPLAAVVWLPAYGSHCGRAELYFRRLAALGLAVYGMDPEGFGESEGGRAGRGEVPSWRRLPFEAVAFCEDTVRRAHPRVPLFLAGEGLGATVALAAALLRPGLCSGLTLLAPALDLPRLRPRARLHAAVARVWPGAPAVPYAHNGEHSRNLAVEEGLDRDPLHCAARRVSARTAGQLLGLVDWVAANAEKLSVPYHVQHGMRDLVSPPDGVRRLYRATRRLAPHRAQVFLYHYCWHDLLHEPEGDEVVQSSIDWIENQLRVSALFKTLD